MACRGFPCFLAVLLICSVLADDLAPAPTDTAKDCAEPDYTTLLSLKTTSALQLAKKEKAIAPKLDEQNQVPGVVFVKMIKVAGELFSNTLAQYAHKRSWRTMQHKNCGEREMGNPLGQATCMCKGHHYIGRGDVPPLPKDGEKYAALYTHMHYNGDVVKNYMVPGAVKLVLLRHPLSVLRSTHAMAAYQAVHQKHIHNSFCQDLALDGDAWRTKCKQVWSGRDSLLDYLDHDASERLRLLFVEKPTDLHEQALAIVDKAALILEDFEVGLQEKFDASMILFERTLKWSREDSLYVDHDVNSHSYHNDKTAKVALDSWSAGKPGGEAILTQLRQGPYLYHEMLYERGAALHEKQTRKALGSEAEVDSAVRSYRAQLVTFTSCMHKAVTKIAHSSGDDSNVCTRSGLELWVKVRPACAKIAIDAAHASMKP